MTAPSQRQGMALAIHVNGFVETLPIGEGTEDGEELSAELVEVWWSHELPGESVTLWFDSNYDEEDASALNLLAMAAHGMLLGATEKARSLHGSVVVTGACVSNVVQPLAPDVLQRVADFCSASGEFLAQWVKGFPADAPSDPYLAR